MGCTASTPAAAKAAAAAPAPAPAPAAAAPTPVPVGKDAVAATVSSAAAGAGAELKGLAADVSKGVKDTADATVDGAKETAALLAAGAKGTVTELKDMVGEVGEAGKQAMVSAAATAGGITSPAASTPQDASAARKNALPVVAVFPASTGVGLDTLRALTAAPNRHACAKIVCIVRNEQGRARVRAMLGDSGLKEPVEFRFADVGNKESMLQAFQGVDRLLLVPPPVENRAELAIDASNVAAKEAKVGHIVLLSVLGAQYESIMFAKQFRKMEKHLEVLKESGDVEFTFLRAVSWMENFYGSIESIMKQGVFYGSHADGKFAPCSTEDVGRAAAAVLAVGSTDSSHHSQKYDITGPELLTGTDMAAIFSRVLGKEVKYQDLPSDQMLQALLGAGVPAWQAPGLVELFELIRNNYGASVSTDVVKVTGGPHTNLERWVYAKKYLFRGEFTPTIAVLPATGQLGSATLDALMRDSRAASVRAIVRTEAAKKAVEQLYAGASQLTVVVGDLANEAAVEEALRDVTTAIIIPPPALVESTDEFVTRAIVQAAKSGVAHTILLSYPDSMQALGGAKRMVAFEATLREHSHSYTTLGCSALMQNLPNVMLQGGAKLSATKGGELHHHLGEGRAAYVDAVQVGEALAAIARDGPLKHHTKKYVASGPQALSGAEIAAAMSNVFHVGVSAKADASREAFTVQLRKLFPPSVAESVDEIWGFIGQGNASGVFPDVAQLVGSNTSLEEYLAREKAAFVE